jgi:hypothetical protein
MLDSYRPAWLFVSDAGFDTFEKFVDWITKPAEGQKPHLINASQENIILTGGSKNNYFSIGGFRFTASVRIDK